MGAQTLRGRFGRDPVAGSCSAGVSVLGFLGAFSFRPPLPLPFLGLEPLGVFDFRVEPFRDLFSGRDFPFLPWLSPSMFSSLANCLQLQADRKLTHAIVFDQKDRTVGPVASFIWNQSGAPERVRSFWERNTRSKGSSFCHENPRWIRVTGSLPHSFAQQSPSKALAANECSRNLEQLGLSLCLLSFPEHRFVF